MAAVRAVQPDMVARRLGLRYINSIDRPGPNPTDWENLISDGLLAGFRVHDNQDQIVRAFSLQRFTSESPGIHPGDEAFQSPA